MYFTFRSFKRPRRARSSRLSSQRRGREGGGRSRFARGIGDTQGFYAEPADEVDRAGIMALEIQRHCSRPGNLSFSLAPERQHLRGLMLPLAISEEVPE